MGENCKLYFYQLVLRIRSSISSFFILCSCVFLVLLTNHGLRSHASVSVISIFIVLSINFVENLKKIIMFTNLAVLFSMCVCRQEH